MIKIDSITDEQKFLLDQGKILPVMEHFYTLQGEGVFAGHAAYFIRLGGCDVGCHWCDVKDSWDADKHPLTNVDELVEIATEKAPIVVITGGEPLIWNLDYITQKIQSKGVRTHIETSGAYHLSGSFDWITLSPKKLAEPQSDVIQAAHELKAIIFNRDDFRFAEKYAQQVNENCRLFLQVEWSKRAQMTPMIVEFVKENPKWAISVQTHKYMDIP